MPFMKKGNIFIKQNIIAYDKDKNIFIKLWKPKKRQVGLTETLQGNINFKHEDIK